MWRVVRHVAPTSKEVHRLLRIQCRYSSTSSSSGSGTKVVVGIVAAASAGFAGAIAYGKYDPEFRSLLENKIPYIHSVFEVLEKDNEQTKISSKITSKEKEKDLTSSSGFMKKRDLNENIVELKRETQPQTTDSSSISSNVNENQITDIVEKLEKSSKEAKIAHVKAVQAIKQHTKVLYEALELPEGKNENILFKEAILAGIDKRDALKLADGKASETKALIEKLKLNSRKLFGHDLNHHVLKRSEESIVKAQEQLQDARSEIASVVNEASTADEYQNLINTSKNELIKELAIILPNYVHGDKMTESDLNLLIVHAHNKIEKLQRQLAKQQVSVKHRFTDSENEVESHMEKFDLEKAVSERVAHLKENFEVELRRHLKRQAAAHSDHLQEVLKMQEQELERTFALSLEEKLLHQKGVFISEISGNIARLKGISSYLNAKSEFDTSSKKMQAVWLASQAMSHKITSGHSDEPCPLEKHIAALKAAAAEGNDFITSILSGIPSEAASRGVYTHETLKQRFQDVKRVCRKVALIDENNDSLYRHFLSYLQSLLVVDGAESIPKAEIEGQIAVDVGDWDTFDILNRVTYCLKVDDLEQAVKYANQLKGEPRVVASEWVKEMRLYLETNLAVKALLAHAAAVGVQAHH